MHHTTLSLHLKKFQHACLLPGLLMAAQAHADLKLTTQPAPPAPEKLLVAAAPAATFTADIAPIKKSFWVNEKIRLRTSASQPHYLYLFNVDPQTGEAIMILPNKLQHDNFYSPHGHLVPDRTVEFFSDRPGKEQIIMVASDKPLPVDVKRYETVGDFVRGKTGEFEKSLGIRLTAEPEKRERNIIVKSIDIEIKGQRLQARQDWLQRSGPVANDDHAPVAFVSTAYNEYYDGDKFDLVFGANRAGFVHIYSLDPNGAYDLLTTAAVDGKTVQTVQIEAAPPYGRHTLVALYGNNAAADRKSIESVMLNAEKSLYVVEQSKRAVAVHSIFVKGY